MGRGKDSFTREGSGRGFRVERNGAGEASTGKNHVIDLHRERVARYGRDGDGVETVAISVCTPTKVCKLEAGTVRCIE